MTYARARLWLGVSCIGTLVLIASFSLILNIPAAILATQENTFPNFVRDMAVFVSLFFLIIAPFDLLGGFAFPREFQRDAPKNLFHFFIAYLRGALTQMIVFCLVAVILTQSFSLLGYMGVALASLFLGFLFIQFQATMSFIVSGVKYLPTKNLDAKCSCPVVFAKSKDTSFTGGMTGSLWKPKIIIPQHWKEILTSRELDVIIARREFAINSSSRTGGVVTALMILCVGTVFSFYMTSSFNNIDPRSSAGYASSMLWNILWSFLGLLIFPTLSRRGSLFVDQNFALQKDASDETNSDDENLQDVLNSALKKIEQFSDDESKRPRWVERIFHPIPARFSRNKVKMSFSFLNYSWQCLRTYLYLSWVVCGLTSRAVHCNLGKPDLWVYLPSD